MKKLVDSFHLITTITTPLKSLVVGLIILLSSLQSFGQVSCDWQIFSFTMSPDPAPPADPIYLACTPLTYTIVLNNLDENLPTPAIRLALTVDPLQFAVDPANNGGFATTIVPSANPAFPTYVDIVQTVTLQPEEQLTIRFNAFVPTTYSTDLDPSIDVRVFANPPTGSSCASDDDRIVFFPEVTRQIGTNGSTYFLGSVALDNPNDNVTELNHLFSVQGGNPANLPRQEAVIHGTMIVDIPYQFSSTSKLVLAEDAQIVINNGAAPLTILGTDIRGCATLWEHLLATNGGKLTVSNSTVRDGMKAINVNGGGSVTINGNTFIDNDVSLYGSGSATIAFNNNTVKSEGGLKPPTGFVQSRPSAGVELHDFNASVTLGDAGGNHFDNLYNGIVAFGTTVNVRNSDFKNMKEGSNAGLPFSGRGIHVENAGIDRKLTQAGLGFAASTPTFDNCTYGIFASGTNIDVQNNKMVNVVVGIESRLAQSKDLTIKFNDIAASRTGINMYQNTRVRTATIEDNKLTIKDPTTGLSNAMGIRCDENSSQASFGAYKYIIQSNTVDVKGGRSGISLNNAGIVLIKNNTVKNLVSSTYGSGIYIEDAPYPRIACNLLQGAGATSETRGLFVKDTYRINARCNQASSHYVNINIEGASDNSLILGNTMGSGFHGFSLGSFGTPGMMGEQRYRGNKWTGSYTSFPAAFPSASSQDQLDNNRFTIDPNFQPLAQFHPANTQPPGWFRDIAPNPWQPTFDCGSANSCPDGVGDEDYPEVLDGLDDDIADGDITSTFCTEAYKWTAQRHLYARLQNNPSLANGNTKMQNFMAAKAGTSIGQFEAVSQQINQMLMPPTADANQLGTNRETLSTKIGEIMAIGAQIAGGTLSTQQVEQKRAQQAQLQQDIAALQVQSDGITSNFNSQKSATALSLLQQNASISANTTYEENQKQVNDIFLRTIARGHADFTPAQLATLLSIADQCYICGGDGVFLARSMYALADPSKLYNDGVLCGGQLIKQEPTQIESAEIQFRLTPNPANDWAVLESLKAEKFEGEIQLLDISGKLVLTQSVLLDKGMQHVLDLTSIQSGYFAVRILKDGKVVATEKLVISK